MGIGTMTARSDRGPIAGLAAHFVLVGALAATAGVTAAGWVAATAYALVLCLLLGAGLQRAGLRTLGPANAVTLFRAILVSGVTALVVTSFQRPVPVALLVVLAAVALALDGVDGQVARRTGTSTPLGARFDMEIDSFLVLVLSVYVAGFCGWWTIAIGAFRYVFVAASWAAPWLTAALPPRFSRKVVAAVQGVALLVVAAGLLPTVLGSAVLALALASLTWSFARDIAWLRRAERTRRARAEVTRSIPLQTRRRPSTVNV